MPAFNVIPTRFVHITKGSESAPTYFVKANPTTGQPDYYEIIGDTSSEAALSQVYPVPSSVPYNVVPFDSLAFVIFEDETTAIVTHCELYGKATAASSSGIKQISDLDAYTDAPIGEIVQYVGPNTVDYTRGFFYERVAGSPSQTAKTFTIIDAYSNTHIQTLVNKTYTKVGEMDFDHLGGWWTLSAEPLSSESVLYGYFEDPPTEMITNAEHQDLINGQFVYGELTEDDLTETVAWEEYEDGEGNKIYVKETYCLDEIHTYAVIVLGVACDSVQGTVTEPTSATSDSWQLIHTTPAIK